MKSKKKMILIIIGIAITGLALPFSIWLVMNNQETRSQAGANDLVFGYSTAIEDDLLGYRHVQIISDQQYFLLSPSKYSGTFTVLGCSNKDNAIGSCINWRKQDVWKDYTGSPYVMKDGVLKLNYPSFPRSYHIKIARSDNPTLFSEELVLEFVPKYSHQISEYKVGKPSEIESIDLGDYYNLKSGNWYKYSTLSYDTVSKSLKPCNTYIEYQKSVSLYGQKVIPQLYMKDQPYCYWGPNRAGDILFYTVDEDYENRFNDYFWVTSFEEYQNHSQGQFPNQLGDFIRESIFKTKKIEGVDFPAYVFGPSDIIDSEVWEFTGDLSNYVSPTAEDQKNNHIKWKIEEGIGDWRIRISRTNVNTPAYSGPAVQVALWEYGEETGAYLREDMYLAEDIGWVKLTQKRFGDLFEKRGYPTLSIDSDNDYYSEHITNAFVDMNLNSYEVMGEEKWDSEDFDIYGKSFLYSTSSDVVDASRRLSFPVDSEQIYYLLSNSGYSGELDVQGCRNDSFIYGSCNNWSDVRKWKSPQNIPYVMNNGVLEIAFKSKTKTVFHLKVAPSGTNDWSDELMTIWN